MYTDSIECLIIQLTVSYLCCNVQLTIAILAQGKPSGQCARAGLFSLRSNPVGASFKQDDRTCTRNFFSILPISPKFRRLTSGYELPGAAGMNSSPQRRATSESLCKSLRQLKND